MVNGKSEMEYAVLCFKLVCFLSGVFWRSSGMAVRVRKSFCLNTLLKSEQVNFDLFYVLVFSCKISFGKRVLLLKEKKKIKKTWKTTEES